MRLRLWVSGMVLAMLAAPVSVAATFTVSQYADSGPGTLRQAILDANANPGPDAIRFTSSARAATEFPHITGLVDIDGRLPSGSSADVIGWDGSGYGVLPQFSLLFAAGSSGSALRNVSLHLAALSIADGVSGVTFAGIGTGAAVSINGDSNLIEDCAFGDRRIGEHTSLRDAQILYVRGDRNEFYGNSVSMIHIYSGTGNRIGRVGKGNTLRGHPWCVGGHTPAVDLRESPTIVEGNFFSACNGMAVSVRGPVGGWSQIIENEMYGFGAGCTVDVAGTRAEILRNPVISEGICRDDGPPAPVLSGVFWQPGSVAVTGAFPSAPGIRHILDFYYRDGWSWRLLESWEVTPDEHGTFAFTHFIPTNLPEEKGDTLAVTVTNAVTRDTSAMGGFAGPGDGNLIGFTSASYVVAENASRIAIPVMRLGVPETSLEVSYDTRNGTAMLRDDYGPASGRLTIPACETLPCPGAVITIPIVADRLPEPDETFTVTLRDPAPAPGTVLGIATATITIQSSEPVSTPTLSMSGLILLAVGLSAFVLARLR